MGFPVSLGRVLESTPLPPPLPTPYSSLSSFLNNPSSFELPINSWVWGHPLELRLPTKDHTLKQLSLPPLRASTVNSISARVGSLPALHWDVYLLLCQSYAGNQSCCKLRNDAVLACPEDMVSLQSPPQSLALTVPFPLPLWPPVLEERM